MNDIKIQTLYKFRIFFLLKINLIQYKFNLIIVSCFI